MRKIVLASASVRRKEILTKVRIPFVVDVSGFDESLGTRSSPSSFVQTIADGKATAVAARHKNAIVIGADTVVYFQGKIIGKPGNALDAKKTLKLLNGKTHTVYTGYCIIDTKSGKRRRGVVATRVDFRRLSQKEIDTYVATGEALDAAGAYTMQGAAAGFAKRIVGDYYNIIGFPIATIIEELKTLDAI